MGTSSQCNLCKLYFSNFDSVESDSINLLFSNASECVSTVHWESTTVGARLQKRSRALRFNMKIIVPRDLYAEFRLIGFQSPPAAYWLFSLNFCP